MNDSNAQPLYFGAAERPLFGWIHRPPPPTPALDMGLVLCNPFGFEAVCSHRTLRHIASRATALGVSVIRFDYDGTGDSAGDDFDPDRVPAWLASIHSAADTLKAATGVSQLCLLGVRLGAVLAANAAFERTDIRGLVQVSPAGRARAYLREIRALHSAVLSVDESESGMLESVGYVMTEETTAAVERLSITRGDRAPAADIFILDRDDFPSARTIASELQQQGSRVEYLATPDHPFLVKSPNFIQLPVHILDNVSRWLADFLARSAVRELSPNHAASAGLGTRVEMPVVQGTVIEEAGFLGQEQRMFAVVSRAADSGAPAASGKGIVLLNSGAVHHIGPSRLYVTLARQWASEGHVVMRVDIVGIGDSIATLAEENVIYSRHARDNVLEALDALRSQYGVQKVLSVGLCSGAYHSFLAAKAGRGLHKAVLLNPLTFYWKDGMSLEEADLSPRAAVAAIEAERYKKSFFNPATWRKLLAGQVDFKAFLSVVGRQLVSKSATALRDLKRLIGADLPNDLPSDFKRIIASGGRAQLIFGSTDLGLPRMMMLGGASIRRLIKSRKIELTIIDGADHTFMQMKHRRILMAVLSESIGRD